MPAYSKQLEDEDGNILYPVTTAGSVVDSDSVDLQTRVDTGVYTGTGNVGSLSPWVDTSDIVDGAVTEAKIDWTGSPCVTTFAFSGTSMTSQNMVRTTKRGTQLTFTMSSNSLYISSGADGIKKVRYSINYRYPTTTGDIGCTALANNTTIWSYFTGCNNGTMVNSREQNSTGSDTYGTLITSGGDKSAFAAIFDAIRISDDSNYDRRKIWNLLGQIICAGSATSFSVNCEVTSETTSCVPSFYQRGAAGTYYDIIVEVYEE